MTYIRFLKSLYRSKKLNLQNPPLVVAVAQLTNRLPLMRTVRCLNPGGDKQTILKLDPEVEGEKYNMEVVTPVPF